MNKQQHSNEEMLMRRVTSKDHTALAELYDQFGSAVYGITHYILQNQVLAEEATQDTFMKVWKQPSQWDPKRGSLKTWLLVIARYKAIDRLRKEKRQSPWTAIGLDDMLHLIGQPDVVDENIWYDANYAKELMKELSEDQRLAINLAFFKGMSHREIAETLKTPLGTIKSRIRSGLNTMKGLWTRERE